WARGDGWPQHPQLSRHGDGGNMSDVDIRTFGCRLNAFESEVMRGHAEAADLKNTIIFNSCAVTKEAERQVRQAIRRAKRNNPEATIIVTGCAAQIHPETFAAMPEVTRVWGNREKMDPASYAPSAPPVHVTDIMQLRDVAPQFVTHFSEKSRAFLQIQQGCNHRCTFCIIPFGRGNSQSIPLGHLVDQIKRLQQQGYQEIVLTGVDLTSYGEDLPSRPTLGQTVQRMLTACSDLPRLRLSSLDPMEVLQDAALMEVLSHHDRVMPFVHLSVQSGSNLILKRMKRRHLRDDVFLLCTMLRSKRPDVVFGADIICGFPTETEADFQDTMGLVQGAFIPLVHAFSYSPHAQTPASKMPQVDKAIRKDRTQRLMALSETKRKPWALLGCAG
ncbi:MAG: tRNA (N(6)-L-threonylcarbamoyladenosine(37)-C(2))-methylthiotransferase MtaB, partial [Alphaproteobacteria bacterium]